jgi:hypothetical protein
MSGRLIRWSAVVLGQPHDGGDGRLVGAPGKTPYGHVTDHPVAQLAHEAPPWRDERQEVMVRRQDGVKQSEAKTNRADQQDNERVIGGDVRATASAV